MIGLDTNVLLRLVVEDDPDQAAKARTAVRALVADGEVCFVGDIVLCEFVWVLEGVMRRDRETIARILDLILDNADIRVESETAARAASALHRQGFDFSDALLGFRNRDAGCTTTLTFDRKAARLPEFQILS
ncbi:putative nucleic-acid-binding protein [Azospirillum brasilense]|uniref:Putative nucleic-acid-binding protein n=1 Tax=Azospirillum brasilense TaxID=192 RepID=A0A560BFW4_AZOBR|nr:type II toxin-antitoxin system VapC family toxin [Azospirillum brasilense]TWA71452.1 putative nucleic-acid-binding protein [Azospirillum brasilense]